jgi:4-hydroxy-2-oxoheptanedioate aldolase
MALRKDFCGEELTFMMKRNRMKTTIKGGGAVYGVLVALPSPALIEMSALAGFDFVIIDQEHGAISPETLENMVRAAEATGICPLARTRDSQPESILAALDRGAQGVVVPHMASPEQASQAARACRFHPRGNRGMAAAGRSSGFGTIPPTEFFNMANDETFLMPMIEDQEGVEKIDQILAVEGIDAILAGAGDLAQAYGVPGQPLHPRTQEIVAKIFDASQKADVPFCAIVKDAAGAKEWKDRGAKCFLTGDDQRIIFAAFKNLIGSIKG